LHAKISEHDLVALAPQLPICCCWDFSLNFSVLLALSLALSQLVCVCGGGCLAEWSITSCYFPSFFNPKPWRVNPNTRTWIEPTFLDISVFRDCLSFLLSSSSFTKKNVVLVLCFVDSWSLCLL
jgi:hypothetical protein